MGHGFTGRRHHCRGSLAATQRQENRGPTLWSQIGVQSVLTLRVGVPYGDFFLIRRLATGGMGEVFLACTESRAGFPARFAIKRVHPAFSQDPDFLKTFLDEARVAAH